MRKPQNKRRPDRQRPKFDKKNQQEADESTPEMDDVVLGKHATIEALQANRGNKLFLQEDIKGNKIEEIKQLAQEKIVSIKWVPKSKLDEMVDGLNHQGIVLKITPYSILRTADAVNVDGVIIPKHRAVGVTPVVVKTSTGAVEHIPISRVTNLSQTVKELKKENIWVFGTDMEGTDYTQWNVSGDIALIIGNEGKGMGQALKKEVDEMITIPIDGHVQSLNASVAAGLLMYEVHRKRR